jgi:heme exporter protein B
MLKTAWLLFRKDLILERRSREFIFTMLTFSLLTTLVFALSFFIESDVAKSYGPGVLWVVILFGGTLGLQRVFEPERENDCLGGILLSPACPRSLYLSKVFFLILFMVLMELIFVPTVFLFFDLFEGLGAATVAMITAVMLLGTLGFAFVGILFAASLVNMRMREVLLPIVVYPLVTPVLIAGVQSTRALLSGAAPSEVLDWVVLLGAFDLIYLGICLWLFPVMVKE